MFDYRLQMQTKAASLGVRVAREAQAKTVNVCWGQWPVVQGVKPKDIAIVKALVALRVQTLHKNNTLAARLDSVQ